MAKKTATRYVCSNCGAITGSWSGNCLQCGEWNTLQEELTAEAVAGSVADWPGAEAAVRGQLGQKRPQAAESAVCRRLTTCLAAASWLAALTC